MRPAHVRGPEPCLRRRLGLPWERADRARTWRRGMSKGMDQKKQTKKEPTKTLKEKRAAKQEKKKK
jgi:hypothetical protein